MSSAWGCWAGCCCITNHGPITRHLRLTTCLRLYTMHRRHQFAISAGGDLYRCIAMEYGMFKTLLTTITLLASPVAALAAPFCLSMPGAPPACFYYDGNACARDAARQTNAVCTANPSEVRIPTSRVGSFCMTTAQGFTQCGYADGNTCASAARGQNGICSTSTGSLPRAVPDRYAPDAGR
jgi:hypothetical protein